MVTGVIASFPHFAPMRNHLINFDGPVYLERRSEMKKENLALNAPRHSTSVARMHFQAKTLQSTGRYKTQQNNQCLHFTPRLLFIFRALDLRSEIDQMEECPTCKQKECSEVTLPIYHVPGATGGVRKSEALAVRSSKISPSEG